MNRDHTQEALDEYYSTGIDPTSGDIGPDELDETEQAFYAEEECVEKAADNESPWDGIDRLEQLIEQKIVEVDAHEKSQATQKAEPTPTSTPKIFSWAGLIWEVAIIGFLIFMLIMLLK